MYVRLCLHVWLGVWPSVCISFILVSQKIYLGCRRCWWMEDITAVNANSFATNVNKSKQRTKVTQQHKKFRKQKPITNPYQLHKYGKKKDSFACSMYVWLAVKLWQSLVTCLFQFSNTPQRKRALRMNTLAYFHEQSHTHIHAQSTNNGGGIENNKSCCTI